jgi:hypothetical protein
MTAPTLDLLTLIGTDTTLTKVANTHGGEYAGACPFCGGDDRFRAQPYHDPPRWWCRQCSPSEHWSSAADYLMQRDSLDFPEAMRQLEGSSAAVLSTKRTYSDLTDYAEAHGAPVEMFKACGWRETTRGHRKALVIRTETGERLRFLDGNEPRYLNPPGYTRSWYLLDEAIALAQRTGGPLVLCNGEASAVAAQHHGLAAFAVAGGSEKPLLPDELLAELRAAWDGTIVVALDCDSTGYKVAPQLAAQLRAASFDARAVDLGGTRGFDLADFTRLHNGTSAAALSALKIIGEASQPAAPVTSEWNILEEDEIERLRPPTFLVKDVLVSGEVTLIAGPSDAGKTWVMVDIAKRVAQHYKVLYVAAEDGTGIRLRKRAWELHYQRPRNGNFQMLADPLPLADPVRIDSFIAAVKQRGAALIVVDTLSQCIAGADENDTGQMAAIVRSATRIAHETGAAVAVLHHYTKDGVTYRGSSTLKNDTYGFLEVTREDDIITLEVNRIKNAPPIPPRHFKLVTVRTDITDDEEQPIDSCVILPAARVIELGDRLTAGQRKILSAMALLCDVEDGVKTTDLERHVGTRGNSFYSALKRLKTLGLARKDGDSRVARWVVTDKGREWLTSNAEQQSSAATATDELPVFEINTRLPGAASGVTPVTTSSYHAATGYYHPGGGTPEDDGSNRNQGGDDEATCNTATPDFTTSATPHSDAVTTSYYHVTTVSTTAAAPASSVTTTTAALLEQCSGSSEREEGEGIDHRQISDDWATYEAVEAKALGLADRVRTAGEERRQLAERYEVLTGGPWRGSPTLEDLRAAVAKLEVDNSPP